ncbi:MAG: acyl-ACP--UDP-N-acetylglucosamine O-acyltransferase [Gemmataceae bacterium]|nr:acyl-ACP--UDP-N-acetylglucosamine O-acyltransferase [Gemmataceae bacterium]
MSGANPRIHPTAVVDPAAVLADTVEIGPCAILLGPVRLGEGCVVGPGACLIGDVIAGANNEFCAGCVIGERAQHRQLQEAPGSVRIGNGNVFREFVTIHRSTQPNHATSVGDGNYFMVNSHIAHDCTVGNGVTMANGAVVGGHAIIEDRVFLSGICGVHQNCRVGKLALVSATGSGPTDVPPFCIMEGRNHIVGVNVVGMKRAGYTSEQIQAVRVAYRLLMSSGMMRAAAESRIEQELGQIEPVAELLRFLRESRRGICLTRARRAG